MKKTALHIIILAAGKGTRMHSALPKVLHQVAGKALVQHVIDTAKKLKPAQIHLVYGAGADLLQKHLANERINFVLQKEQLGTAHAVAQVLPHIPQDASVLILYGDVPLISANTLRLFLQKTGPQNLGVLTAFFKNPFGFGRIVRDSKKRMLAIVEEKEADDATRAIQEINSGIMTMPARLLQQYLPKIKAQNQQKEYYLTDIISLAVKESLQVQSLAATELEVSGVNNKSQLEKIERAFQQKQAQEFMQQGVTIMDANRFDLRGTLKVGTDVTIDVNTIFEGNVVIGAGSKIGPNSYLKDVTLGKNVVIKANSVLEGATIENDCVIGPFARIRPTSKIKQGAHIGNFVEVKNSTLGKKSKANHLTYLGDTIVGSEVNVGAGVITCNYDGANKHVTTIADGAFIGSNAALVAPVKIGKNATIGAGSVITEDAPPGKLTLERAKQQTRPDWKRPAKQ